MKNFDKKISLKKFTNSLSSTEIWELENILNQEKIAKKLREYHKNFWKYRGGLLACIFTFFTTLVWWLFFTEHQIV